MLNNCNEHIENVRKLYGLRCRMYNRNGCEVVIVLSVCTCMTLIQHLLAKYQGALIRVASTDYSP